MTLAERREQVERSRGKWAPAHAYSDSPTRKAGDGARGIVVGYKGRDAHAFNVVNVKGDVIFLDGQTGHANHLGYWRSFQLLRTD
ncbi:toxin glutamine deamidase domain-containing protein [Streptomyces griseosporeus]|uniref:toxin glutamine deamidase domain-containing protein n=1 Tax=Streptomyces griseosporeus TaxID=1910 RepID=UPI00167D9E19